MKRPPSPKSPPPGVPKGPRPAPSKSPFGLLGEIRKLEGEVRNRVQNASARVNLVRKALEENQAEDGKMLSTLIAKLMEIEKDLDEVING